MLGEFMVEVVDAWKGPGPIRQMLVGIALMPTVGMSVVKVCKYMTAESPSTDPEYGVGMSRNIMVRTVVVVLVVVKTNHE